MKGRVACGAAGRPVRPGLSRSEQDRSWSQMTTCRLPAGLWLSPDPATLGRSAPDPRDVMVRPIERRR